MSNQRKREVAIGAKALSKNDRIAAENRERLRAVGLYVVNFISSPGAGKTTLLERMAEHLRDDLIVIEGDLQTRRDAERVERAGARAHQIETGGACHLDAAAVRTALDALAIEICTARVLVIENVGNLVCPSSYDLGEHMKAALLSLPEGDDKVLKYPSIFKRVGALVITKTDLAPHLDFDAERAIRECESLNDSFETFRISARTGEGVSAFCDRILAWQSGLPASSKA